MWLTVVCRWSCDGAPTRVNRAVCRLGCRLGVFLSRAVPRCSLFAGMCVSASRFPSLPISLSFSLALLPSLRLPPPPPLPLPSAPNPPLSPPFSSRRRTLVCTHPSPTLYLLIAPASVPGIACSKCMPSLYCHATCMTTVFCLHPCPSRPRSPSPCRRLAPPRIPVYA